VELFSGGGFILFTILSVGDPGGYFSSTTSGNLSADMILLDDRIGLTVWRILSVGEPGTFFCSPI